MLPLELVLKIVAVHYHPVREEWNDDTPGPKIRIRSLSVLATCSLVCHAWHDICCPLIFRSIYKSPNRLSFLHFEAPHLCRYTLELCLDFGGFSLIAVPDPSWMSACLSRFTNLRDLELVRLREMEPASTESWAGEIASMLSAISLKRVALLSLGYAQDNGTDMLPILSACSNSLEELTIDYFSWNSTHGTVLPSFVRFEALRKLELSGFPFPRSSIFECPTLESLVITRHDNVWDLPPWIPEGISELTLRGARFAFLPLRVTYPTRLSIQLESGKGSDVMRLCEQINRLPLVELLPSLTIKIHNNRNHNRDRPLYLPGYGCYKALCRLNQQLHPPNPLGQLILPLGETLITDPEADKLYCMRMREVARLEEVFAPLLQSSTFSAQLVLELRDGLVMQWSV